MAFHLLEFLCGFRFFPKLEEVFCRPEMSTRFDEGFQFIFLLAHPPVNVGCFLRFSGLHEHRCGVGRPSQLNEQFSCRFETVKLLHSIIIPDCQGI